MSKEALTVPSFNPSLSNLFQDYLLPARGVLITDYMPCFSGEEIYVNIEFAFIYHIQKDQLVQNLSFVGFGHCNILKIVLTMLKILNYVRFQPLLPTFDGFLAGQGRLEIILMCLFFF